MITEFDDFVTWMYVLIDDIWQLLAPLYPRPGPAPDRSDSELLTLAIVGECREWDKETNAPSITDVCAAQFKILSTLTSITRGPVISMPELHPGALRAVMP